MSRYRAPSQSYESDDEDESCFCPKCDPCPTCGSEPEYMPVPHRDSTLLYSQRERILPTVPFALPFTLFILEAYLQGGWMRLLIPYTICILVYYL